ncbi:Type I phosphodiesterase / nucleotide pyrophosphatase [Spirosomataceae bacterium TFI 002]|nr:Type I phosphodiesterase / nucleotide pyrophosphatase [Spirosomataceae bacterium TFI 002]
MKNFFLFFMLIIANSAFGQKKKCLLILVDGIPIDVLQKTATPHIDKIASMGSFAKAFVGGEQGGESESPTISAVGYNSMLTGTWANKHNVWGNSIKAPNYTYTSIFQVARASNNEAKLAIYSTWEDNRTKLLGENLPETNNLMLDIAFDGYENDTNSFPHDANREYIKNIDQLVVREASTSILKNGPDLSWVYLEYTDDMGHKYGDSPQMTAAVELVDEQIGKLYKAVQKREKKYKEEWLFIVTTDHGRDLKTGKNHGGQSERERTIWILSNQKQVNDRFQNGLAIVDIFPSVVQFMNFELTKEVASNLDGKSFLK